MKLTEPFETRFPNDVYSIIPKTLVVAALVFAFTENWLITLAAGIPAGLLLHFIPNAYDCKVLLKGSTISFHFFRPWFRKEEFNLESMDRATVEPESADATLKDIWWRADMTWPIGNSKLRLYRNNYLVHTVNFRTNVEDTRKLAALLHSRFSSAIHITQP